MRKIIMTLTIAICSCFAAQALYADMYYGNAIMRTGDDVVKFKGESSGVYLSPMEVTNKASGQSFMAYCGDFRISTSAGFGNSNVGQSYGAFSLDSPGLTLYQDWQKSMIRELFSFTHAEAFNDDGSVRDSTIAKAIQLVVWEILTESFTENPPLRSEFTLDDGSFALNGESYTDLVLQTDKFFDALFGVLDWEDDLNYTYVDYDMTVYVADPSNHASQTLISVTNAATPEPATMLIFGAGLVLGAPLLRRRMKKVKS